MLIRRVTLENFGLFGGRNVLELAPQVRYGRPRPVILVGGKNGAGKTTILEAIRLCLYGPLALGGRVSGREYEQYLTDRVHREESALVDADSAAVGIEFEYAEFGQRHVYDVRRSWELRPNGVQTVLSVLRDGSPLDEIDQAQADDFLRELVPLGVSQLYFFDGEKIQELADNESDDLALADAVRGLLGLDLLERLRGDLRIYSGRLQDTPGAAPLQDELAALERERTSLEEHRLESVRQLDRCKSLMDRLRQDIARSEQRIAKEGGAFAKQREALIAERDQLGATIGATEDEIRDLCEGLLPFTLASDWCAKLRDQLLREEKEQARLAYEDVVGERMGNLDGSLDELLRSPDLELPPNLRKKLAARLAKLVEDVFCRSEGVPQITLIHRLADDDRRRLLGAIDRVLNDIPGQLKTIQIRLEQATMRLRDVERDIQKAPAEGQIQPLLDQLKVLHRDLAAAAQDVERNETAVKGVDLQLADLARRERKLEDQLANAEHGLDRRAMVARVQNVLSDYSKELTKAKAKELSDAVAQRFAQLWRKGDVVRRLEINPSGFDVRLFDRHDRRVPKSELSAGEKQIYAISVLWGLAQVSGRPLPMVIDTPLGRLDSDHRGHLVERYFPHASHQVIILSTDTEIDQAYFKDLGPEVSHSYHLRFDPHAERTIVEEGYFWSRRQREIAYATQ